MDAPSIRRPRCASRGHTALAPWGVQCTTYQGDSMAPNATVTRRPAHSNAVIPGNASTRAESLLGCGAARPVARRARRQVYVQLPRSHQGARRSSRGGLQALRLERTSPDRLCPVAASVLGTCPLPRSPLPLRKSDDVSRETHRALRHRHGIERHTSLPKRLAMPGGWSS